MFEIKKTAERVLAASGKKVTMVTLNPVDYDEVKDEVSALGLEVTLCFECKPGTMMLSTGSPDGK